MLPFEVKGIKVCLNIISLVRQGILENDELFGYIKLSCKDKKVVVHM